MRLAKSLQNRIFGKMLRQCIVSFGNMIRLRNWWSRVVFQQRCREYFLGRLRSKNWLYEQILSEYRSPEGHLDFGAFRLPIVAPQDRNIFAYEFGDVAAPVLFGEGPDWIEGPYEVGEVRVQPGDVVVDAGANMGLFSVGAASRGAHVYAFEPMPRALEYLKATVDLNRSLVGSISIVPLALMEASREISFTDDPDNLGGSSAVLTRSGTNISVHGTSLDEWVRSNGISRVDFIKADIEGAERNLLSGATDVLRRFKPKLSICTYHLPDDPEVLEQIIRAANPDYVIRHGEHKLYAS